jgi:hypothetical protein
MNTPEITWPKGPVYWTGGKTLYVSIPFTWNLPDVRIRLLQKSFMWERAVIGGPAVRLLPNYFDDLSHVTVGENDSSVLQRINPLATRTTAGCPNRCGFCGVNRICGAFQEFEEWPDRPVLIDDNLFAASQTHFDKVIDRLIQWEWADFNQGVDARLLTDYHARRIAEIAQVTVRLALDSMAYVDDWLTAVDTLKRNSVVKTHIRSYALVGFRTGPDDAWTRCEFIEKHVRKVLPMWYHPLDAMQPNIVTAAQQALGWNDFERKRLMTWFYKHKRVKKAQVRIPREFALV